MNNFLHCSGNKSFDSAIRLLPKRAVLLKKKVDEDAPLNMEEFRVTEALRRSGELAENVKERQGFLQLGDQATDRERLGVRREFSKVNAQLLDERVTQRFLKEVFPDEQKEEAGMGVKRKINVPEEQLDDGVERGRLGKIFHLGKHAFKKLTNFISPKTDPEKRFLEAFDDQKTIAGMSMRLANRALEDLNDAQRSIVQSSLQTLGVELPPVPANLPRGFTPQTALRYQQAVQLASARPWELAQMRDLAYQQDPNILDHFVTRAVGLTHEIFARRAASPPLSPFDRLLQFKKIEGQERHEMVSSTVYDPQRLANFIRDLEHSNHDVHHLLLHEVLEHDALYKLEHNAEAMALVHYLESRMSDPNAPDLKPELEDLVKKLKDIKIKESHGHGHDDHHEEGKEKPEDKKKKIEEANELLATKYSGLNDLYTEAATLGKELLEESMALAKYNQNLETILAAAATARANPAPGGNRGGNNQQDSSANTVKDLIKETKASITAKQAVKKQMFTSVREAETAFLKSATDLKKLLDDSKALPAVATPDPVSNLRVMITRIVDTEPDRSKEKGVFGITNAEEAAAAIAEAARAPAASRTADPTGPSDDESPLRKIFRDHFKPENAKKAKKEVIDECLKVFKLKTQLKPYELLVELMRGEAVRVGIMDPAMAYADAEASADMLVDEAGVMLQVHRSTNLEHQQWLSKDHGKMSRAKQWVKDWYQNRKVYRGKDLINYIAGMDKNFSVFKDMPPDIQESDIIDRISRVGDIRSPEMYKTLFDYSMRLRSSYLKFESAHHEGKIELDDRDAEAMEKLIRTLLKVRAVLRASARQEKVNTMHGNKAEIVLNMLREKYETQMKDERTIFQKVTDKLADWKNMFSKKFLKDKFLDKIHEKKKEAKASGMSDGDFEHSIEESGLSTAYKALSTALAMKEAYDVAKVAAGVGKSALGAVADKGGKVASVGVNKVAKPVVRHGIVRPIKWIGGTALKIAKAPFVLAGNIVGPMWKWAFTPSKAGGHGGGHGGGGHGGGHH
ncbi:hypothetical protein IT413_03815 [Candidatus Peregrinibacteria bacterium]|nr:hypothetical protein [Candidatus Peregrinibacteria bacterium]